MVAAIGSGDAFSKGRDFAAWLGLVPKQFSTGDRTILGKISKRGNRYLRVLFVHPIERLWLKHDIAGAVKFPTFDRDALRFLIPWLSDYVIARPVVRNF